MNLFRLIAHQHNEHIEIVNHHVQDNSNIDRPKCHRRDAINFDETRAQIGNVSNRNHHWIKSHNMTNLQYRRATLRGFCHSTSLNLIGSQWFFDKAVNASRKELFNDGAVRHRWCCDHTCVDTSCNQFIDRSKRATSILFDHVAAPCGAFIDDTNQISAFKLRAEPCMMLAHSPYADDSTTNCCGW